MYVVNQGKNKQTAKRFCSVQIIVKKSVKLKPSKVKHDMNIWNYMLCEEI